MRLNPWISALAGALLASCSSSYRPQPLPADHPANPGAPHPAVEAFVDPLADSAPSPTPLAEAPRHARWTCPMHPEVVRDAPGECPECGMSLVPERVPEHGGHRR